MNKKRRHVSSGMLLPAAFFLLCCKLFCPVSAHCSDLAVLSLDELLDLNVVSVAKVPEKMIRTPAAITIITAEDLRRNSIQSIPEALRMVPGLHVYRIDANKWAVSARGFASRFANKMLVMIDGRSVYSTFFSGVFWDVQDTMIEDIDRIEVIRGPGGTLWGANAVNGVINIITKDSADTQGGLVALQAETGPGGEVSARYGGWLNDKISYRIYGKYFDRDNFDALDGTDAADDWHQARGGFRMDMNISATSKLTLEGDIYDGKSGESVRYITPFPPFQNLATTEAPVSGGNLLGRWTRTFSKDSEIVFQIYYDHLKRNEFFVDETVDTADFDFQHRLRAVAGMEIIYGLGYRYSRGNTAGKEAIPGVYSYALDPRVREDNLYNGMLLGRLPFAGNRGELTLGTKVEHNDYTGFEWQPSARVLWSLTANHSIWSSISRSVRTPSRLEQDADVNAGAFLLPPQQGGLFSFVRLLGNKEVDSETVYSYEAGYRGRLSEHIFVDFDTYYNKYQDLIDGVPVGPIFSEQSQVGNRLILPIMVDNGADGETYGVELSCSWSVTDWWRLTGAYTWFHMNILNSGNSREARQGFEKDDNADQLFSLISYMDLPANLEINSTLYAVGSLGGLNIDAHYQFDLSVSWHATEKMTLAVGGHNLFDDSHQEFADCMDGILASAIPRILYTKLTFSF